MNSAATGIETMNLRSELLETLGTISLVKLDSVGELLLEPGKVVDEGGRVAEVALANALHLGLVLDGLGISNRRASLGGVLLAEGNSHSQVSTGTEKEFLLVGLQVSRQGTQVIKDGLVRLDNNLSTEVLTDDSRGGLFLEVKVDIVGGDDGVGEEDGVAVDVGTAQIEQPGDLIQSRDDESGDALLLEILAQLLDLFCVGASGGFGREGHQLGSRASGAILPDQIDQVGDGDQR